jgi:TolB-like protein/Tfp pilus assembly protein PilF
MADLGLAIDPAVLREELSRVISSRAFAGSKSLIEFLRFVVETVIDGRADQIKEYVIGVEVFRRGADFDPRTDTIVRVQAIKLRLRLSRYFETEGATDPVRILMPKGNYVPSFERLQVAPPEQRRPPPSRIAKLVAAGILTIVLSAGGVYLHQRAGRRTGIPSLAVLPFLNLTGDPRNDYLSDGLTEELLEHLAQIDGLRVPARTSSFQFKNKAGDIGEIGRKLKVTAVLEGSLRNNGKRFHVTAQLNRVQDGHPLWSGSFEADLKDTLGLERDLAQAIVRELGRYGISSVLRRRISPESPAPGAHNLYLQGRYFWNKRTEQGFHTAIRNFEEAVARDPRYALAWVGLADSLILLFINGHAPPHAVLAKAESAVGRALALDESMAEAHAAKATLLTAQGNLDPRATEFEYRRAIALSEGYASAHQWYSRFLADQQRFDESLHEIQIAEDLDPISPIIAHARGLTLHRMGRTEDAVAAWRRATELESNFPPSLEQLSRAYFDKGDCDAAIAIQQQAAVGSGELRRRAVLGHLMAKCGKRLEAAGILQEVLTAAKVRYVSPVYILPLAMALGKHKVALDELERAFQEGHPFAFKLKDNPTLVPLRSEPRFLALLKKTTTQTGSPLTGVR